LIDHLLARGHKLEQEAVSAGQALASLMLHDRAGVQPLRRD
jgi:hypothetical protein